MEQTLRKLESLFPAVTFKHGTTFCWSPKIQEICYSTSGSDEANIWALLHETGHAAHGHRSFASDFELLLMEVAAWEKAQEIATHLGLLISTDHIQDCLDTYRDWLHQRSTCPTCSSTSFQHSSDTYRCHNCSSEWHVSSSRFCRAYRRRKLNNRDKRLAPKPAATFI